MENQSDKSQEATPYKLEEARKKGQVGKSQELVSAGSLLVMCIGICIALPKLAHLITFSTVAWLKNTNQIASSPALFLVMTKNYVFDIAKVVASIMALGMMSAIIISIIHAGPVFSLFPLKFDFSKLNPVNGIKKIFSLRTLIDVVKLVLKVTFFSMGLVLIWRQLKYKIFQIDNLSINVLVSNWKSSLITVLAVMLGIYLFFAIFDLWYSKREFAKKMRMSTRDIKEEYRKREGDPELKNKRKKTLIEFLKNVAGAARLQEADVIITNPTHLAVALKYRSKTMALPIVITKGKGFFAMFIIGRAKRHGIPIYRRPPLARKLFAESKHHGVIPVDQQQLVAEIYREIIKSPDNKVFS